MWFAGFREAQTHKSGCLRHQEKDWLSAFSMFLKRCSLCCKDFSAISAVLFLDFILIKKILYDVF